MDKSERERLRRRYSELVESLEETGDRYPALLEEFPALLDALDVAEAELAIFRAAVQVHEVNLLSLSAENARLRAENARLRGALENLIRECDLWEADMIQAGLPIPDFDLHVARSALYG